MWILLGRNRLKMKTIKLDINDCSECSYFDEERVYTGDSFENVFKWICKKYKKKIAVVETFDKKPEIPKWCKE